LVTCLLAQLKQNESCFWTRFFNSSLWVDFVIYPSFSLGVQLAPMVKTLFHPSILLISCVTQGVNAGDITSRGQSSPLWVKVHPYGSKFTPRGQSSPLGFTVHP
jgi:hypothetical protein